MKPSSDDFVPFTLLFGLSVLNGSIRIGQGRFIPYLDFSRLSGNKALIEIGHQALSFIGGRPQLPYLRHNGPFQVQFTAKQLDPGYYILFWQYAFEDVYWLALKHLPKE